MGTALVKMRIMPESPTVNLKEIEEQAKKILEKEEGKNPRAEIEPVAFGLNAIILGFSLDESKSIDNIENKLKNIPNVNSAEVVDFRRAFG
jgi:translation elongation factor aEF-1 beta